MVVPCRMMMWMLSDVHVTDVKLMIDVHVKRRNAMDLVAHYYLRRVWNSNHVLASC